MDCRIASGKIYAKDLSAPDQPYLFLGNAQLALAISEEEQTLPDYTNVAGGNACSVRDISGVALTMTMYSFDKKNLALAVYGEASDGAGAAVVNEAVQLFAEGTTPLEFMWDGTTPPNLTVGATVYAVDVDYTISAGGITVIPGSALDTAIAASVTGTPKFLTGAIDYTHEDADVVEALTTSGKTFALRVHTQNKAAGGASEIWDYWKVQFGPTGGLNIITREFGSFEVSGEVLPDATRGVGESQYFRIQQAKVA